MIEWSKEKPNVFISYSWDDDIHKGWVKSLADLLLVNGVNAILDEYDTDPGDRLPHFMEEAVSKADKVLVVCTEKYKEKADKRKGGVGYEEHIISSELMKGKENKFIPIIRKGNSITSIPICLSGKKYIDLSKKDKGVSFKMRKNEYTSINEFVSQYVGEWNPSEGHWLGLDFLYHGSEYRFHTGSMYETDAKLPDGREIMFGIYRKNNSKKGKEYEILGEFANMDEALECKVIEGTCFKDIIMADETELIGQD